MTGAQRLRAAVWLGALAFLPALGCRTVPPDPEGRPAGARTLALGSSESDALNCDQGDCADWYVVEVPAKGTLTLELGADAATAADVDVELILYDSKGTALETDHTAGKSAL